MQVVFADADADPWRDLIAKLSWDQLPASAYNDHLKDCNNCQTSLYQFFEIRDRVDYTSEPCFHIAYWSADVPSRCIEKGWNVYSIATMDKSGVGVVIGVCPWCGTALPTGAPLS
jgi:hypothetical protein